MQSKMGSELARLSQEMRDAVEQEMRVVLRAEGRPPDRLHAMIQYHMGWLDSEMEPIDANGGKLIRPMLCLMSCMAAGGNWSAAVPAAAAVEILHNFSLVHDDIEDASPMRRGRPTVWKLWGIELAINAGDAMFALAHLALNRLRLRQVAASIIVQALRRFDETCLRLTQGQHADMEFESREEVSVVEYVEMITGKTAVLLSLCAELGAMIAGCDADKVAHYAAFGRDLGLAFQVKDDILGIWGDEHLTGKSAATDVITKKKTLPILYGLSRSTRLRRLYGQTEINDNFVGEVVRELGELGARGFATDKAVQYSNSALNHLQAAHPVGPAAVAIGQLADLLLQRDY